MPIINLSANYNSIPGQITNITYGQPTEQPPVIDPTTTPANGWYFKNTGTTNKINWYYYNPIQQTDSTSVKTFSSLRSGYALITLYSIQQLPYFAIYTAGSFAELYTDTIKETGDFATWYRSRHNYVNLDTPITEPGTYLFYFGEKPTGFDSYPSRQLAFNTSSSTGPRNSSEVIKFLSIQTSTLVDAAKYEFTILNVGYIVDSDDYRYDLSPKIITFNTDDATSISNQRLIYGNTPTQPADPTKTGHTFNGWFSNSALTTPYNFTSPVIADSTIYAKFTRITRTLTFKNSDGSNYQVQTVNLGSTATPPTPPTRTGSTFVGWFTDIDLTNSYNFTSTVNNNIILYPKFNLNTYVVSFNSNSSTIYVPLNVQHNKRITPPTPPTRTGFTFVGWFTNTELTTLYNFSNVVFSNLTLYAKWNPIPAAKNATIALLNPYSSFSNVDISPTWRTADRITSLDRPGLLNLSSFVFIQDIINTISSLLRKNNFNVVTIPSVSSSDNIIRKVRALNERNPAFLLALTTSKGDPNNFNKRFQTSKLGLNLSFQSSTTEKNSENLANKIVPKINAENIGIITTQPITNDKQTIIGQASITPYLEISAGFIDNIIDIRKMNTREFRNKFATAIAKGICEFYGVTFTP